MICNRRKKKTTEDMKQKAKQAILSPQLSQAPKRPHSSTATDRISKRLRLNDNVELPSTIEIVSSNSENNDYVKGGLVHSLHGIVYQLKLLMLFLKRALDRGYSFKLGTEVKDVQGFDDVVFRYKKNGEHTIRFVQAKHKQDQSKTITVRNLLTNKDAQNSDFSLEKYFISYREIKKKYSEKSKEFILYTNIDFNYADLKKSSINAKWISERDEILCIAKSDKSAIRYKLGIKKRHQLYKQLSETSDLYLLAKQLALHISKKKKLELKNDIFHRFHGLLIKKVLKLISDKKNQAEKYVNFRNGFANGKNLSVEVGNFRNALQSILGKKDNEFCKLLHETKLPVVNTFWKLFKETPEGTFFSPKDALSKDKVKNTEIRDFFDELVFAVNQPNEVELGEIIEKEMGKTSQFNQLNADLVTSSFQKKMLEWFKKKNGEWLNSKSGNEFFNSTAQKISGLISEGLSVAYSEKIEGYDIKFGKNNLFTEVKTFLSPTNVAPRVLHIVTLEKTTLLSAINVYCGMDFVKEDLVHYKDPNSYIFMQLSTLLRPQTQKRIMDSFASEKCYLFIINCASSPVEDAIQKLSKELFDYLWKSKEKKIIFLAKKDHIIAKQFQQISKGKKFKQNVFNDEINFNGLEKKSKQTLLKKEVMFQEEKLSLSKLIGESDEIAGQVIDGGTFIKLIKGDKITIGNKPPSMSDLKGAYSELFEDVNMETFCDNLYSTESSDIYIISGITDPRRLIILASQYVKHINRSNVDLKSQIGILNEEDMARAINKRIQLTDGQFKEKNFKHICHNNPERKIYWLNAKHKSNKPEFRLEQIYNPDFYLMDQRFSDEVVIGKEIKKDLVNPDLSEIFIISGRKEEVSRWFQFIDGEDEENYEKNCQNGKILVLEDPVYLDATFQKIVEKNQSKTVHKLRFIPFEANEGQLIWYDTKGSYEMLIKSRAKVYNIKSLIGEVELIRDKKVLIIAGDPGTGKSTTLVKLYELSQSGQDSIIKSHWLISVSLKGHLPAIREIKYSNSDIDKEIIEFLWKVEKNQNDKFFVTGLLGMALKKNFMKPLLIVFDGFDEVLDKPDRDKIISLLKHLKDKTKAKIWITSRLHYEPELESALSTFAVRLQPMLRPTIKKFITKFFCNCLSLMLSKEEFRKITDEGIENKRMAEYTEKFLSKMDKVFKGDVSQFIGTPLQLYLMLEGSRAAEYFKEPDNAKIPDFSYLGDNIWEVYEKFIDRRFNVHFEKSDAKEQLQQDLFKVICDGYYKDLAKVLIFQSPQKKSFQKFKDIVLSVGIVISDGSDIDFIHPTFKEYFAANVFINWITKEWNEFLNPTKKEYLLKEILMNPNHKLTRNFMDLQLININELPEESLKQFGEITSKLSKGKPNHLIDNGKTILHIAFEENNGGIINLLLKIMAARKDEDLVLKLLEERDKDNHDTVLNIAVKNKDYAVLNKLFQIVKEYNDNIKEKIILAAVFRKKQDKNDRDVKYLSSKFENDENLQKVYNRLTETQIHDLISVFLDKPSKEKANHILNSVSNSNIGDYLLKSVTQKGNNVLHKAARLGDYEFVKFLVNEKKMDVTNVCDKKRTALHKAARAGSLDVIEFLVDEGANIHTEDNWRDTPLRDAIRCGKLDVIDYLYNKTDKSNLTNRNEVGCTALDDAAVLGHLDVVQWLLINEYWCLDKLVSAKDFAEKGNDDDLTNYIIAGDYVNPVKVTDIVYILTDKITKVLVLSKESIPK